MGRGVFISRRWAFGVAYFIGVLIAVLLVVVVVQNSRRNDRQDARAQEIQDQARIALAVNKALCTAIPNVAGRTAQALLDILVADARRHHRPEAGIRDTQRLGRLYITHARALALSDLRACTKLTPKEAP
jgi:hypothetical protein